MFVSTEDRVRLAYRDWGSGKPVVFVTGWATTAEVWQYNFVDFAARGFRCVSFDRRGHGRSDVPPGGYEIERLADDLATVLDTLDLRDVTLVGWSLGGAESVAYLERHGTRRVSRLVLLAAATPCLSRSESNPEGIDPALSAAVRAAWAEDFPRWCDASADAFFRPDALGVSPGIVAWMKRLLLSTPVPVALRCGEVLAGIDQRQALSKLDLPVLIVHGDADASIPVQFGRQAAKLARRCRYVEIPGAPHGFFFTHRQRIANEVCGWLAEG